MNIIVTANEDEPMQRLIDSDDEHNWSVSTGSEGVKEEERKQEEAWMEAE